MGWSVQDLGAAGEFVSALTVLATLLYLAYQLRQNGKIAEAGFHQNSVALTGPVMEWVARDESIARILQIGLLDLNGLNDVERMRFSGLMYHWIMGFKSVMEAHERGLLDEPTYQAWQFHVAAYLNMPGGSIWWEHARASFIPEIGTRIEKASATTPRMDQVDLVAWGLDSKPS